MFLGRTVKNVAKTRKRREIKKRTNKWEGRLAIEWDCK